MSDKQIVHISSGDPADGRSITKAQAAMRRWHDDGYAVHPSVDGHPEGKVCPACSASDPEMTYSGPQVMLPTEVGTVQATWTDNDHVHVSANASSGHDPGDVVYRGKHWYVGLHLFGTDGWGENGRDTSGYRHQFTEAGSLGSHTIASTYRAKIVEAIQDAVATYAAAHPEVLVEAQRNHLSHDLATAEKELADLHDQATAKRAEVGKFRSQLLELPAPSGCCPACEGTE